jgi:dCTP deaminase
MIFSDRQIRRALQSGRIVVDPLPQEDQFAPSAVDLRVGGEFRIWRMPEGYDGRPLRLSEVNLSGFGAWLEDLPAGEDGRVVIPPGQFVLAKTHERISLPETARLAARVEGRSSFARLGLVVHMTAPTIHAGFDGHVVLEMMNFGPFPLEIDPGETRICQVIFEELGEDPSCAIRTVFQGQSDVIGSLRR